MRSIGRRWLMAILLAIGLGLSAGARADGNQVRIVMPYGLAYLPVYVAVDRGLIQKHATAAGLGEIKTSIVHMASGPSSSDVLLAGDADLAMGGFGNAFVLWDKTRGAQRVRAMTPLSGGPILLLSTDPKIRSIRDFGPNDRIALSGIKITAQAIAIQMAAAKEWGWDQRFRLDSHLVPMSNPDAMAMLLSGSSEVKTHAAILPFSVEEMESGKVHLVMNSDDYLDPGSSVAVMYASARFREGNRKVYDAAAAAFEEAFGFIRDNPREAVKIYVAREPQKRDVRWIEAMIVDPKQMRYSSVPRGMKKYADFMHAAGTLKSKPDSWKDLFWDNMWEKDGS